MPAVWKLYVIHYYYLAFCASLSAFIVMKRLRVWGYVPKLSFLIVNEIKNIEDVDVWL